MTLTAQEITSKLTEQYKDVQVSIEFITPQQAQIAAEAGADWIVTGTLTEDAADLSDLREKISAITNLLSIINWESD